MNLNRELGNKKWLLLGILLPIIFGLMQDKLPNTAPAFLTAAYWRAPLLEAANKLEVGNLYAIVLLSLAVITASTFVCTLFVQRTANTTTDGKVIRQGETADSGPGTDSRHVHF